MRSSDDRGRRQVDGRGHEGDHPRDQAGEFSTTPTRRKRIKKASALPERLREFSSSGEEIGPDDLTATERAEGAFKKYVKSLPEDKRDDVEQRAWGNSFSVETHREYRDDLHRWEVALATAKMIADQERLEE